MPLDVKIKRWHAVAAWTWDAGGAHASMASDAPAPLPSSTTTSLPTRMPLRMRPTSLKQHQHAAAGDDVCGICRNPFDGCPPDGKHPGDDSPVVWGTCGHAFHLQCIQKWLGSQQEQRCPICRRNWEFKVATTAEAEEGEQPATPTP